VSSRSGPLAQPAAKPITAKAANADGFVTKQEGMGALVKRLNEVMSDVVFR